MHQYCVHVPLLSTLFTLTVIKRQGVIPGKLWGGALSDDNPVITCRLGMMGEIISGLSPCYLYTRLTGGSETRGSLQVRCWSLVGCIDVKNTGSRAGLYPRMTRLTCRPLFIVKFISAHIPPSGSVMLTRAHGHFTYSATSCLGILLEVSPQKTLWLVQVFRRTTMSPLWHFTLKSTFSSISLLILPVIHLGFQVHTNITHNILTQVYKKCVHILSIRLNIANKRRTNRTWWYCLSLAYAIYRPILHYIPVVNLGNHLLFCLLSHT